MITAATQHPSLSEAATGGPGGGGCSSVGAGIIIIVPDAPNPCANGDVLVMNKLYNKGWVLGAFFGNHPFEQL